MKWLVIFFLLCLPTAYSSEIKDANRLKLAHETSSNFGQFQLNVLANEPVAGARVDLTISLKLAVDLTPGSAIAFIGHWLYQTEFQRVDPEGANYLAYQPRGQSARFDESEVRQLVHFGGLEAVIPLPVYTLRASPIKAGTILQFHIKKVSLPELAPQHFVIRPLVRLSENEPFGAVAGSGIGVVPGSLSRIRLIADSVARPGEDINLRLRLEDQFGNLTHDRDLSLDLLVNGQFRNRIGVTDSYVVIPNTRLNEQGVYQLEVRTGGGGLRAVSNPVLISVTEADVAWLSIGKHTIASDGVQTHKEILRSNLGVFDETLTVDHRSFSVIPELRVTGTYTVGQGVVLTDPRGNTVGVGLAEGPTDIRHFDPDTLNLIQTAGPASDYLWLGEAAASRGYRVGFIAFDHSHQFPGVAQDVYTGLINEKGNDWFHSLAAGRTFVSIGEKILVLIDQSELLLSRPRELNVEIVAASDIERVELFKNGAEFMRHTTGITDESTYTLTVKSSNRPLSGLEAKPRNRREWIGFLATRDTEIEPQPGRRHWRLRRAGDKRFDFLTWLHGGSRQLNFKIGKHTPDTVVEIRLAGIIEDAAWLPADRDPQSIPPQHFLVPLPELRQGAVREFEVAGYLDRIEVGPADKPGNKTVQRSFIDTSSPRIGDYYYIKAVLANGAYAYSSPIFVEKEQ